MSAFSAALKMAKFWVGPTSARPGPMLPIEAAEAVAAVIRSAAPIDSSSAPRPQVDR